MRRPPPPRVLGRCYPLTVRAARALTCVWPRPIGSAAGTAATYVLDVYGEQCGAEEGGAGGEGGGGMLLLYGLLEMLADPQIDKLLYGAEQVLCRCVPQG